MKKYITSIENKLQHFARVVIRFRWIVLALTFSMLAFLGSQLQSLKFDTTMEGFFYADDPALVDYEAFKQQFGSDQSAMLMIKTPDIFEPETIAKLDALHKRLEQDVPHLDEVLSLINVTSVRGSENELIVEDLVEELPRTDAELSLLKERTMSNSFYLNQFISEDGKITMVIARMLAVKSDSSGTDDLLSFDDALSSNANDLAMESENASAEAEKLEAEKITLTEKSEFMNAVKAVVRDFKSDDFQIYTGGLMSMETTIMDSMMRNMPVFTAIAIGMIIILLALVFKSFSGVALPLLVVLFSLVSTIGLMSWLGHPFTTVTQILPSFILAVGIGDSVHFLTIFFKRFRQNGNSREAIVYAMGYTGLAMIMTTLTTAAGLLSFVSVELMPVADLGIFGAAGVIMALMFTLLFLPAALAVLPLRQQHKSSGKASADNIVVKIGLYGVNKPRQVLGGFLVLCVLAALGASRLVFSHDPISWMPKGHDLRVSNDLINKDMKGAMVVEVLVDGKTADSIKKPELMKALADFSAQAEQTSLGRMSIAKSQSAADTLKQIHQALNENRPEFYVIPDNQELISQELLLFENSGGDGLERFADAPYSKARVTMRLPWYDANSYPPVLEKLNQLADENFGSLAETSFTGMIVLMTRTIMLMIDSMATSYLIAIPAIALLMVFLVGSWRIGLLSMIPNFLPIFFGLGFMGAVGLRLDIMSILIGSIALGLAVDDTIHFFHHFSGYYEKTKNVAEAVRETLSNTGTAMSFTTVVLAVAFFSYSFSEMNNLFSFGLVTGIIVILAWLADVLLSPALLALLYGYKKTV